MQKLGIGTDHEQIGKGSQQEERRKDRRIEWLGRSQKPCQRSARVIKMVGVHEEKYPHRSGNDHCLENEQQGYVGEAEERIFPLT